MAAQLGRGDPFVSWRISESKREVYMLKDALKKEKVEVNIIGELPGGKLATAVFKGIAECQLAIIFASETYGTPTSGVIDTQKELLAILDQKKEYFLIKMCDELRDPVARGLITFSSTSYVEWRPGTEMPDKLVQKICEKLSSCALGGSSLDTAEEEARADDEDNLDTAEAEARADDEMRRKMETAPTEIAGCRFILNHKNEPLYAPAPIWTCDKDGVNKRLMALMFSGTTLASKKAAGNGELEKCEWRIQEVPGKATYYILNHKNEPLYAPHPDWKCDKDGENNRLMALMFRGTTLASKKTCKGELEKCEWTFQKVDGKATYYILNHKNEPLYAPHPKWKCDKDGENKRLMALMFRGSTLAFKQAAGNGELEKCEWQLV